MKLVSLTVTNHPPINLFAVQDLSDVVVIAGPNGVGKSRLLQRVIEFLRNANPDPEISAIVGATSPEEATEWKKEVLDLDNQEDIQLFRTTLQANRRRQNWRSSLLNFESDRSIQRVDKLAFSWDVVDPIDEEIPWDFGSQFLTNRYQDTVHSMYRMIEARKQKIANRALQLQREGKTSMQLKFPDPMAPFKEVFSLLLAPKLLADPSARRQVLEYEMDGQTHPFSSLSSGEREVVNIAFDFLLRKPQDCIVFFDEPELHLHPELSYRLIQTLQQIGSNNQFIFSTHSPDVITASLDRSVVFLGPQEASGDEAPVNQAIPVSESDETNKALRLLGQSVGILALGKQILLIEGTNSSIDKQTYGAIIRDKWPQLVLVASGGKHTLESFSNIYEHVLSKSLWGVEFFMLCDADSAPPSLADAGQKAVESGRLKVLPRYHLENYFLDEHVWAAAFESLEQEGSWLRTPTEVRKVIRGLAMEFVSYATALHIASQVRLAAGNVDIMVKDSHAKQLSEIVNQIDSQLSVERDRLEGILSSNQILDNATKYFEQLTKSLDEDSDDWKRLIPGKAVLGKFASKAGIDIGRARTMYLNAADTKGLDPFAEVAEIFGQLAS